MRVCSVKETLAVLVLVGAAALPAMAETGTKCNLDCEIDLVNKAQSVVMYHTKDIVIGQMGEALMDAARRGVRVEAFVGMPDETYGKLNKLLEERFRKWVATAPDEDASLLGMDACLIVTSIEPFLITDPIAWLPGQKNPAFVKAGILTSRNPAEVGEASDIVQNEEFMQCKLN